MAEWLFEIFSEEIPSRMQLAAQAQLKTLAESHLTNVGLACTEIKTFVTPRRLTLVVQGLPLEVPEKREEKKGPSVTAPQTAIDGFLNTVGLSQDACHIRSTPKGDCFFAVKIIPARPTQDLLPSIALGCLKDFNWVKSMRWGSQPTPWVRPIRGLLSLFDREVVPFTYAGVTASNITHGHRFLAPHPFEVACFKDYEQKLRENFVLLDWYERRRLIAQKIAKLAQDVLLTPLKDENLLDEVTGLVEWPIGLKGAVDPQFMSLPREVITTPMRHHQRYFPLEDAHHNLAPAFGVIANIESPDHGETITRGNERVLQARLADAKFFWEQDLKIPLETFNTTLKNRLFHQHLGTIFNKVQRLVALSTKLAETLGQSGIIVARAALLCKADLASQMVGEFPELQGIMGKYYAQHQGEDAEVAQAIEEHYWPKGAEGNTPSAVPSILLGIADRVDTLIGFFTIGLTPTGSKDPYALRRAALGLIALTLTPYTKFSIKDVLSWAYDNYPWSDLPAPHINSKDETLREVWRFLLERFKFFLKDKQGSPYDHVEAVLSVAHEVPSFSELALRTHALDQLMKEEDGQNLLTAYKRAVHILTIEESKDHRTYSGNVELNSLVEGAEKNLFRELQLTSEEVSHSIQQGNFISAVQKLADLRPAVDRFFEEVVVNCEEKDRRENRLQLLAFLRQTLSQIADFSKIEGLSA